MILWSCDPIISHGFLIALRNISIFHQTLLFNLTSRGVFNLNLNSTICKFEIAHWIFVSNINLVLTPYNVQWVSIKNTKHKETRLQSLKAIYSNFLLQWLISPCCSHAHILPPYIYTTYIYHSCSSELTVQWDHLHLVRWACVGVGNVQTTTEYCANYRHVIPLKHNSNTVHPVSAITRTKWTTQDTNSLLPDSQRLVILFHIRNVKTLWANFSPHIYHKPLARPALLVPPGLNSISLSRSLYLLSSLVITNWGRKLIEEG